ncbi:hypothetical protein [Pseudomonas sp. H3_E03]
MYVAISGAISKTPEEMLRCGTPRFLRKTQSGKGVVHIKDHDAADRAIAEAQVICGGVNQHAPRPAHVLGGALSLGKVATTDQQRYVGMSGAQRPGGVMANGARTTH